MRGTIRHLHPENGGAFVCPHDNDVRGTFLPREELPPFPFEGQVVELELRDDGRPTSVRAI